MLLANRLYILKFFIVLFSFPSFWQFLSSSSSPFFCVHQTSSLSTASYLSNASSCVFVFILFSWVSICVCWGMWSWLWFFRYEWVLEFLHDCVVFRSYIYMSMYVCATVSAYMCLSVLVEVLREFLWQGVHECAFLLLYVFEI